MQQQGFRTDSAAVLAADPARLGLSSGVEQLHRLFETFPTGPDGRIWAWQLLSRLGKAGLLPDDPRVRQAFARSTPAGELRPEAQPIRLDLPEFMAFVGPDSSPVRRALAGELVVPRFAELTAEVTRIYEELLPDNSGAVADYIPRLAQVDPEQFAISVCTADGQRFSIGDAGTPFCVQSITKPFLYAMAVDENGADAVHALVGQEQSGGAFNMLALNEGGRPHNPMINAGAIGTSLMIRPDLDLASRYELLERNWTGLMGGRRPGFDNATYLSERATGHRNYALAAELANQGVVPANVDPQVAAEFYFQACSIEVDADRLAGAAASLANGGAAPFTGDQVLSRDTVRDVLSMMSTSGMYDYSGEFFRKVGQPAKSGVSGGVMLVVPGVMGVCVWSPRLDARGNSVRGINVCEKLGEVYNLHAFDSDPAKQSLRAPGERAVLAPGPESGLTAQPGQDSAEAARRAFDGLRGPAPATAGPKGAPAGEYRPRHDLKPDGPGLVSH